MVVALWLLTYVMVFTGVAVHYSSNHVYFSEGTRIWSKGAGNLTDLSDLKLLHSAPLEVTALSVDWLYQRIYYVSSGKVCIYPVNYCRE